MSAATADKTSYKDVPFRNILINGDMSIAQRGTSEASLTSGSNYIVDRTMWQIGTAGTWTVSQDTDVPTGEGFASSLKLDCTTDNGSLSAGSYGILVQRIEGQNLQYIKKGTASAESLTLSFWVKTNLTGTYQVNLLDSDNTRVIGKTYTISSADTWEQKEITFAGDTTGALGNDNGNSLQIEFWFIAGSTYSGGAVPTSWEATATTDRCATAVNLSSSTSNYLNITGLQLEVGTSASDFEFLPVDVNLRRCQRYYFSRDYQKRQFATDSNQYSHDETAFPTTLRAAPTLVWTTSGSDGWTQNAFENITTSGTRIDFRSSASGANGYMYGSFTATAEL